ncbi:MAG: LysM peptidoglycan-binding domain-containing protein [Verrucomicrobia bacterium]|nr:LysM peptidoglycan-binding domain-containing protein [Verrucomicrobiota bacterium]MBV8417816.1 LysM peptidoglycan-binding domain-containing protein [Verrucomicrobiota bacterium]
MDAKRIYQIVLVTLLPFSTALAQDKGAEATKSEALTLKAQMVEFENLKAEIKAQGDKIDRLTQEVAKLSEALKQKPEQKSAPPVARAEPVPTATPATPNAPATTAGVDNPAPADAGNTKTHIVAKGETLTQISKQYGVTVEEIEQLNKIGDAKKLQAGQTIKIPVSQSPSPSPSP